MHFTPVIRSPGEPTEVYEIWSYYTSDLLFADNWRTIVWASFAVKYCNSVIIAFPLNSYVDSMVTTVDSSCEYFVEKKLLNKEVFLDKIGKEYSQKFKAYQILM